MGAFEPNFLVLCHMHTKHAPCHGNATLVQGPVFKVQWIRATGQQISDVALGCIRIQKDDVRQLGEAVKCC